MVWLQNTYFFGISTCLQMPWMLDFYLNFVLESWAHELKMGSRTHSAGFMNSISPIQGETQRDRVRNYLDFRNVDLANCDLFVVLSYTRALLTAIIERDIIKLCTHTHFSNTCCIRFSYMSIGLGVVVNKRSSDRVIRSAINVSAVRTFTVGLLIQLEGCVWANVFDVFYLSI